MVSKKNLGILVVLFVISSGFGPSVQATPVTFYFSGEITRMSDDDNVFGSQVTLGTPFSGWYTFESEAMDFRTDESGWGDYRNVINHFIVWVGPYRMEGRNSESSIIQIVNGSTQSQFPTVGYGYDAWSAVQFGELLNMGAGLLLADATGSLPEGDALLQVPPSIEELEDKRFQAGNQGGHPSSFVFVEGTLGTISLVPEPTTGILGLLGGIFVLTRRSRVKASR